MFADLTAKRVLLVTPGKNGAVLDVSAAELLRQNCRPKANQYVAINISAAYAEGVSDNLGNAQVVYHNFYFIPNAAEACDQIRKAEDRPDAVKHDRLGRARWMWLKNRANMTEK